MKTNSFLKKISALCVAALLSIFLGGCFDTSLDEKGVYAISTVEFFPNTLTIENFETHRGENFEFRLEEGGKATVSYIYFTNLGGDNVYYANSGSAVTTYRVKDDRIILEGGITGAGAIDIHVHDGGWLILNYKIENQLVYTAKYRK